MLFCKCASPLPKPTSSNKSLCSSRLSSYLRRQRPKKTNFQTSRLKMLFTLRRPNTTMIITRDQQTRSIPSTSWVNSNTSKRARYLWSLSLSAAQAPLWCWSFLSISQLLSINRGETSGLWLSSVSQVAQVLAYPWTTLNMTALERNNNPAH